MFLTKKSLRKILIMAGAYFILGSFCITLGTMFANLGVGDGFLLILGVISLALGVLFAFWGRYAEGKGKLINLGNRLVRKELKPAEFIKEYEILKNSKDLVINKPSFEVLQLVVLAYNCLEEQESCLSVADEMIAVADEKKKTMAKLFKVSILFAYNRTEEADELFNELRKCKLNLMCTAMADAILKSDRAMAMGDYKTVEAYNLKMLEQEFPKLDNCSKLVYNYKLGEIYEKLNDKEKAISFYRYCADNGGETAIRASAKAAIEKLQ